MKLRVSFKHMEHTDALDEFIQNKSERLNKYLVRDFQVHWICEVNGDQHRAEVVVNSRQFGEFFAKASSETLYKSVDMALDKLEKQIKKHKSSRIHDHKEFAWDESVA